MADSVRVQFSASIGALINGVEDAKKAINSVRTSVDGVTAGAKSLLEAFGVAFSAERIIDFVSSMAEAGEQIERTSAMLGLSTRSTQEFGYIAKMTGGDAQMMAAKMEQLQVNLQRAQNPTSQQAQALHALGLSAKDLLGVPLDEQLNRIADAVSKFADGGNKTAIVMALLGRSGAQMIPILDQGRAGLEALREQADSTGAVLSQQTVRALSELNSAGTAAKAAIIGLGASLVGSLAPALTSVADKMREWIADQNALITSGNLWQAQLEGLKYAVGSLAESVAHAAMIIADFFKLDWSAVAADWKRAEAEQQDLLRQYYANLNPLIAQGKKKIQLGLGPEAATGGLPQAPSIDVNASLGAAQQQAAIQTQIKSVDDYFATVKEKLAADAAAHRITYDQETQDLIAAIRQRDVSEQTWYDSEIALVKAAGKNFEAVEKQKVAAHDKAMLEIQKATDAAVKKDQKDWETALKPLQSAFDSQLKGLLSGTETWGQAMKKIFADFVMDAIKNLEKLAIEKAAAGLAGSTGGGPLNLLGGGSGGAGGGLGILGILGSLLKKFLPGFDVGSWSVPGDMVAQVHQGEVILPNNGMADAFRSGQLGGGSSSVAINMSGNVGNQAWFNSMAQQMSRALQNYQLRTPSTGWSPA